MKNTVLQRSLLNALFALFSFSDVNGLKAQKQEKKGVIVLVVQGID